MAKVTMESLVPVVRMIAWKYAKRCGNRLLYDDAYRHALLGLVEGYKRYDKRRKGWRNGLEKRVRMAIIDGFRQESPFTRHQQRRGTYEYDRLDDARFDESTYDDDSLCVDDVCSLLSCGRQKEVVRLRFDGYTMKEIADRFGVDESRVSQIIKEIRKKVASYFNLKS